MATAETVKKVVMQYLVQFDKATPLPDANVTTAGDGWQRCPKCNGDGLVFCKYITTLQATEKCPVCSGKMIINKKTGKPPKD